MGRYTRCDCDPGRSLNRWMMEDAMPLPTKEQLAQMTPEEVLGLWRIVREYRLKMMALGQMPVSAIEEMTKCVGDKLMADIVNDHRRSVPEPSSLAGPVEPQAPSVRGTGWQKPADWGLRQGLSMLMRLRSILLR